jgi:protein involved in polysaccharide export with SLBB domain
MPHNLDKLLRYGALFLVFASASFAQNSNSNLSSATPNAQAGSYYYVARPNEMTMQVNVWGFVYHPGRYEVATTVDLIQLLSFAGGPTNDADIEDVRLTRVVRRDGIISTKEIRFNLKKLDRTEEAKLMLQPGDTIIIEHTAWVTWREVVSVVTTAAIETAAVAQIMNYSK